MSEASPLVSVIMPCRNFEKLVGTSLENLRQQTLTDWECIVVDDDSTDSSPQIVAEFASRDPRFSLIRSEKVGQAQARNLALEQCRGKYIQFLDADDMLEPRKLEVQSAYLEQHPGVELIWGDVVLFTADPDDPLKMTGLVEFSQMPPDAREALVRQLARENFLDINSLLVTAKLMRRYNGFDRTLKAVEDWDLLFKALHDGIGYHYEPAAGTRSLKRTHQGNLSHDKARIYRAIIGMRSGWRKFLKDVELARTNEELLRDAQAGLSIELGRRGDLREAITTMLGVAWRGRSVKWLLFALALPLLSNEKFSMKLRNLRRRLFRAG